MNSLDVTVYRHPVGMRSIYSILPESPIGLIEKGPEFEETQSRSIEPKLCFKPRITRINANKNKFLEDDIIVEKT